MVIYTHYILYSSLQTPNDYIISSYPLVQGFQTFLYPRTLSNILVARRVPSEI